MLNKLDKLLEQSKKLEKKYYDSFRYYSYIDNLLIIPSIVLTSIASVFSFLSTSTMIDKRDQNFYLLMVAIVTAVSSLMQTISGSCKYSVKRDQFNQAANDLNSLVDRISFEILEENEQDFINSVEDEIKRIKDNCKFLP